MESPVWGWFGDENPFAFNLEYRPAQDMSRFLVGTPPVLSMAGIEPGLDLILKAGIGSIRKKSIRLTEYLLYLINEKLKPLSFTTGTPLRPENRGSHVALRHPEAFRICQAMIFPADNSVKVIPDFREPDNIRLGVAPLYNSYEEMYLAIDRIERIVEEKLYLNYSGERAGVT